MIEYTITIQRILLNQGEILTFITPVNVEGLTPLRHVVSIGKDKFAEISQMSSDEILESIRADIIKSSPSFQYKWEIQQAAIDAGLSESLISAEGQELSTVTESEQAALAPEASESGEVII